VDKIHNKVNDGKNKLSGYVEFRGSIDSFSLYEEEVRTQRKRQINSLNKVKKNTINWSFLVAVIHNSF